MDTSSELTPELRLPLEILANVIYLTKHHSGSSEQVEVYMGVAEKAFAEIVAALKRDSGESADAGQS